jgi:hypothetical protein
LTQPARDPRGHAASQNQHREQKGAGDVGGEVWGQQWESTGRHRHEGDQTVHTPGFCSQLTSL